jgi:hypothetical protein
MLCCMLPVVLSCISNFPGRPVSWVAVGCVHMLGGYMIIKLKLNIIKHNTGKLRNVMIDMYNARNRNTDSH